MPSKSTCRPCAIRVRIWRGRDISPLNRPCCNAMRRSTEHAHVVHYLSVVLLCPLCRSLALSLSLLSQPHKLFVRWHICSRALLLRRRRRLENRDATLDAYTSHTHTHTTHELNESPRPANQSSSITWSGALKRSRP